MVASLTWMYPGLLVDSMREAVFMVSPLQLCAEAVVMRVIALWLESLGFQWASLQSHFLFFEFEWGKGGMTTAFLKPQAIATLLCAMW